MTSVSATRKVGRYEILRELGRGGTGGLHARIHRGDGTRSAGSVADLPGRPFGVLGTHRFGPAGLYRAVVRTRSTGGAGARATSTIRVAR